MRVLIAGCGDVGSVLAENLLAAGHTVFGLKRNTASLPEAVKAIAADLTDPSTLNDLPPDIDWLVFMPTPSERTLEAYKAIYVQGWVNLWAALKQLPSRCLVVSSTSVYGQSDGSWVDEDTDSVPTRFNGRILLDMEATARAVFNNTIIARLSGIYGPGREGLLKMASAAQQVQASPPMYSNRIHRDDAAAALAHLLQLDKPDNLYLVTDDLPVAKYEVMSWLAEQMGFKPPAMLENMTAGSGKRISNQRLRDSGLQLKYPDYKAGYSQILTQRNNHAVSG